MAANGLAFARRHAKLTSLGARPHLAAGRVRRPQSQHPPARPVTDRVQAVPSLYDYDVVPEARALATDLV